MGPWICPDVSFTLQTLLVIQVIADTVSVPICVCGPLCSSGHIDPLNSRVHCNELRNEAYCRLFSMFNLLFSKTNAPFPPAGAGRFGAGSEGAVLFRSVTCRVSTANSALMGGAGFKPDSDSRSRYVATIS